MTVQIWDWHSKTAARVLKAHSTRSDLSGEGGVVWGEVSGVSRGEEEDYERVSSVVTGLSTEQAAGWVGLQDPAIHCKTFGQAKAVSQSLQKIWLDYMVKTAWGATSQTWWAIRKNILHTSFLHFLQIYNLWFNPHQMTERKRRTRQGKWSVN